MKTILLCGLFLLAILQINGRAVNMNWPDLPAYLEFMRQLGAECGKELGPKKLMYFPKNFATLVEYPEDNESLNALTGCTFSKLNIVNKDAEVDETTLEEYILAIGRVAGKTSAEDVEVVRNITKICKDKKGDDYGQVAIRIQNCILKTCEELNFRK